MSTLKKYMKKKVPPSFNASKLAIGEMMETKTGEIVIRSYNSIVSLTYPEQTWDTQATLSGRKLERGEYVTITQD